MRRAGHAPRAPRSAVWILAGLSGSIPASVAADATGQPCSDWAEAVVVDRGQRTWVGGVAADNRVLEWDGGHAHYGDFAVARLRSNGSVDGRFGDGGSVIFDEGDFDSVSDLAQDWEGVVAAGTTADRVENRRGPGDAVVFKLDEHGRLRHGFGIDGVARFDLGGNERVVNVAAGWFGEVFVAGTVEREASTTGFLLRLDARGRPDASFGTEGVLELVHATGIEQLLGMRLTPAGLMVGGLGHVDGVPHAIVARLDRRGQLVSRFARQGVAATPIDGEVSADGTAFFSELGSSAVSFSIPSQPGTLVATIVFDRHGQVRTTPSGETLVVDAPTASHDSASAGAFFWGRTLYLAGATYPEDFATGDAFLARTSLRGALDPNFGGGLVSAHFDLEYAAFNDLALGARAVTVVGWNIGEADDTLPPSDALVVRYDHNGQLDSGFGEGGVVMLDFMQGRAVCGPRVVEE